MLGCAVLLAGLLVTGCGDPKPAPQSPSVPLRIVSLGPSLTEFCFALGVGDRLIGVTESCDHPKAARSLPRVGRYDGASIEAILLLEPDLVLVPAEGLMREAAEQLGALGQPIYNVALADLDALPEVAGALGARLGVPRAGDSLAASLASRLAAVRAGRGAHAPRAVLVYGSQPLVVAGPGSFGDSLLRAAGATNAFADAPLAYPRPGWDEMIARAPQLVILSAMDAYDRETWLRFPEIPAVEQERMFAVDPDLLSRPGPRLLEGLEKVAELVQRIEASVP